MLPISMRRVAVAVAAAATLPIVLSAGGPAAAATPTTPLNSVAAAPVPAISGAAGTDTTITMTYGGLQRTYTLFVPNNLPTGPRPLMVALHYLSGTAAVMEKQSGIDTGAAVNGALVAYPQGVGNSWNGGTCCGTARDQDVDDVGFLNAVLDDVEARYPVNTAHVAMGGFSNGGVMSYRYACSGSTRVQSFFIGSGVALSPTCSIGGPLAFLHMHGLLDAKVPWLGTKTSLLTLNGILPSIPSTVS